MVIFLENIEGAAHTDCNTNFNSNQKSSAVFDNLKNYDSNLIMQELGKFNFKVNVIRNGLQKYMIFIINNKLLFLDNFLFISSSLDSLVKNLSKEDLEYFSQDFVNNVIDLLKPKWFYPYEYMSSFWKVYRTIAEQRWVL